MKIITKIIIGIIILLFIVAGSYGLDNQHQKFLEDQDRKAHSICEKVNSTYLSHVKGFGPTWYVSCYDKVRGINEEVRFK